LRVAVPLGDPEAMDWLRAYRFPDLVPLERGRTITVLGTPR